MRNFVFTYTPIVKYGEAIKRHRLITLTKSTDNLGLDSKRALGIFISSTGTLKNNDIISIQEIDENDKPIGEPIKPMGENAVVPTI